METDGFPKCFHDAWTQRRQGVWGPDYDDGDGRSAHLPDACGKVPKKGRPVDGSRLRICRGNRCKVCSLFHTGHGRILDFVMAYPFNCNLQRKKCLRSLNLENVPLASQTPSIMQRPNKDEARFSRKQNANT